MICIQLWVHGWKQSLDVDDDEDEIKVSSATSFGKTQRGCANQFEL